MINIEDHLLARANALAEAESKWLNLRRQFSLHKSHGGCQCDWYSYWNVHATSIMKPSGWYIHLALPLER